MLFAALLTMGTGIGLIVGALSHPKIFAFVTGTRPSSADFHDCLKY